MDPAFVLLSVLSACAPMRMALPAGLGEGAALPVAGRGDLAGGYTIGGYAVSPQPRGFSSSERTDHLLSTPGVRVEPFALLITAPSGDTLDVACELRGEFQRSFEDKFRYADGQVECTGKDLVLSWHRPADRTVAGSLSLAGESFDYTPVREAAGSGGSVNAGAVLLRDGAPIGAVERLAPGRVVVAAGAGANAELAAVVLLAAVISTEDLLARWLSDYRADLESADSFKRL